MSAADSFTRIVSVVAELSRDARAGIDSHSVADIAARHGVTPADVAADPRTLTILSDRGADADWLLSLCIAQQGDQVSLTSRGPFRRPVRLSPEEQVALQLALTLEPGGAALAERLAKALQGSPQRAAGEPGDNTVGTGSADLLRGAVASRSTVEIRYAGERDQEIRTRVVHPYQVVEVGLRTYVVAWATDVGAWRHFRLDRILDARTTGEHFEVREDFRPIVNPEDVFRRSDPVVDVTVRFHNDAAGWVTEFYPDHRVVEDGRVEVQLPAASVEWLTRQVLEHGVDAEVVAPPEYRDAIRRAVA